MKKPNSPANSKPKTNNSLYKDITSPVGEYIRGNSPQVFKKKKIIAKPNPIYGLARFTTSTSIPILSMSAEYIPSDIKEESKSYTFTESCSSWESKGNNKNSSKIASEDANDVTGSDIETVHQPLFYNFDISKTSCIVYQNWLQVKSSSRVPSNKRLWKKRWVILQNNVMYVYRKPTSKEPVIVVLVNGISLDLKPLEVEPLFLTAPVETANINPNPNPNVDKFPVEAKSEWVLCLRTLSGRSLYFSEKKEELEAWQRMLKRSTEKSLYSGVGSRNAPVAITDYIFLIPGFVFVSLMVVFHFIEGFFKQRKSNNRVNLD